MNANVSKRKAYGSIERLPVFHRTIRLPAGPWAGGQSPRPERKQVTPVDGTFERIAGTTDGHYPKKKSTVFW